MGSPAGPFLPIFRELQRQITAFVDSRDKFGERYKGTKLAVKVLHLTDCDTAMIQEEMLTDHFLHMVMAVTAWVVLTKSRHAPDHRRIQGSAILCVRFVLGLSNPLVILYASCVVMLQSSLVRFSQGFC